MADPLDCLGNPNSPSAQAMFPTPHPERRALANLCEHGLTPMVVTGCLTASLVSHFASPDNLLFPWARKRFSDIVARPSMLFIEAMHRWRPENADATPAILIREGDWVERRHQTINDDGGLNFSTGTVGYFKIYDCQHVVFVLATEGGEALNLAAEVHRYLLYTSKDFQDAVGLEQYTVSSIGGLAYVKNQPQVYAVPLAINYVVEQSWSVTPNSPRLKKVVFKMSQILPGG